MDAQVSGAVFLYDFSFPQSGIESLKKIFHEFNKRMDGAVTAIDGSRLVACDSMNNNFTKNELEDRVKYGHIEEYLWILGNADRQEYLEEVQNS